MLSQRLKLSNRLRCASNTGYVLQGLEPPDSLSADQRQAMQRDRAFLEQLTDNTKAGPTLSWPKHLSVPAQPRQGET